MPITVIGAVPTAVPATDKVSILTQYGGSRQLTSKPINSEADLKCGNCLKENQVVKWSEIADGGDIYFGRMVREGRGHLKLNLNFTLINKSVVPICSK